MRFSALTTSRTTSRITSRATSRAIPLAAALAAVLTLGAAPADATTAPRLSTAFVLPGAKVYPEGITSDPRTGTVYVGSYADGTVYRARPGQDTAEVFLPAGTDGRHTANGLSVDAHGRLWVTDSTNGVAVYDTRTGSRLARFGIPGGAPSFVNDLALTPDGTAYLTDSLRAAVYRVTPAQLAAGFRRAGGGVRPERRDHPATGGRCLPERHRRRPGGPLPADRRHDHAATSTASTSARAPCPASPSAAATSSTGTASSSPPAASCAWPTTPPTP